ncbi:hypothetical protein GCM10010434_101300 [Winogradskya humida]
MAREADARVEVLSERSEFSQVFAEPDGRITYESTVVPKRVHRSDGTWADVDYTLQRSDGQLRPVASYADVRFSTGGNGPLVTMTESGKDFTLGWSGGALPAPQVSGDTATYVDVLPGVDLLVRATDMGFSHILRVKTASAAADSALARITFDVGGDARLWRSPTGSLQAIAGNVLLASAPGTCQGIEASGS